MQPSPRVLSTDCKRDSNRFERDFQQDFAVPAPWPFSVGKWCIRSDRVGLASESDAGIQNLKMGKMWADNHIHDIVISYLAKYEPLAFRRLKVRKNFGNSSSLIFKVESLFCTFRKHSKTNQFRPNVVCLWKFDFGYFLYYRRIPNKYPPLNKWSGTKFIPSNFP